jgi:phage gpG-like protein
MKITIKNKKDWKKLTKVIQKEVTKVDIDDIKTSTAKLIKEEIKDNIKPFSDSGKLLRSIKIKESRNSLIIYSDVPYAEIVDIGGKIRITDKMRKKMWALYYETKNTMYKAIALTKKSFVTIKPHNYTKLNVGKLSSFIAIKLRKQLNKK